SEATWRRSHRMARRQRITEHVIYSNPDGRLVQDRRRCGSAANGASLSGVPPRIDAARCRAATAALRPSGTASGVRKEKREVIMTITARAKAGLKARAT